MQMERIERMQLIESEKICFIHQNLLDPRSTLLIFQPDTRIDNGEQNV